MLETASDKQKCLKLQFVIADRNMNVLLQMEKLYFVSTVLYIVRTGYFCTFRKYITHFSGVIPVNYCDINSSMVNMFSTFLVQYSVLF